MKKFNKLIGIIVLVVVIAFSMVACDPGFNSGSGNPFVGNWVGTLNYYNGFSTQSYSATATATETVCTVRCPALGISDSGTYIASGNTAIIRDSSGYAFATATVSGNKLSIIVTNGYLEGSSAEFTRQ